MEKFTTAKISNFNLLRIWEIFHYNIMYFFFNLVWIFVLKTSGKFQAWVYHRLRSAVITVMQNRGISVQCQQIASAGQILFFYVKWLEAVLLQMRMQAFLWNIYFLTVNNCINCYVMWCLLVPHISRWMGVCYCVTVCHVIYDK